VDGFVFGADLDPTVQPFLDDHRIDGTPVLPGVMGIEAFVEAARLLAPDRLPASVESIQFAAPFKFYRDAPRTVEVHARALADGDDVVVQCQLVGSRRVASQDADLETVHFAGNVRMRREADIQPIDTPTRVPEHADGSTADDLYRVYFHGPAYRVVDSLVRGDGGVSGRLRSGLPEHHRPSDRPLQAAPRLIELAFQTAGTVEMRDDQVMGLPSFIRSVRFGPARPVEAGGEIAFATRDAAGAFDVVVLRDGEPLLALEGYRTAALPTALPDAAAEVLGALVG
jgi:hypothetical protein